MARYTSDGAQSQESEKKRKRVGGRNGGMKERRKKGNGERGGKSRSEKGRKGGDEEGKAPGEGGFVGGVQQVGTKHHTKEERKRGKQGREEGEGGVWERWRNVFVSLGYEDEEG